MGCGAVRSVSAGTAGTGNALGGRDEGGASCRSEVDGAVDGAMDGAGVALTQTHQDWRADISIAVLTVTLLVAAGGFGLCLDGTRTPRTTWAGVELSGKSWWAALCCLVLSSS